MTTTVTEALRLIASFNDKTLIASDMGEDFDRGHQLGANKAFNQAADIARAYIPLAEAQEEAVKALQAICSEFAQQHPLIKAGREALDCLTPTATPEK